MKRALGIPAAVVVLVVLPGIVSQAAETDEPPPKEAALTVNLEGEQGGSGDPYLFAATAAGEAPAGAATLRDAGGLHTGTVAPAANCPAPARIAVPDEEKTWCLQLKDVDAGYELTGAATGGGEKPESVLKLTVNRRDGFCGKPLLVLILGLVAGALAALIKPGLRSPVRRTVLGKLQKDNESTMGPGHIEGLTEFVAGRLRQGEAIDDLITKVTGLRKNGPPANLAARKDLQEVLEGKRAVLADYALLPVARKEAARTDTRADDFYGADGAGKAAPATELAGAVKTLTKNIDFMKKLRSQIEELAGADQKEPLQALRRAEDVAKEADTLTAAKRIPVLLDEAKDKFEVARAKGVREVERGGEEPPAVAPALAGPAVPPSPDAPELGGSDLAGSRRLLFAVTAVSILAILAFAYVTIKQAAYDPKLTFHSGADYFTLFSAAFASAAVGSVILLVGYWSPVTPADEE